MVIRRYTQAMLEAYEQRSREVIEMFISHRISFEECKAELDDAFGDVITKVTGKDLLAVTVLATKNSDAVMDEMKRRGSS